MYLVDANQAEEYGEEEGYMDDDEFLEMMEREAAAGRLQMHEDSESDNE